LTKSQDSVYLLQIRFCAIWISCKSLFSSELFSSRVSHHVEYPLNVWDLVNGRPEDIRRFNEEGCYILDLPNIEDNDLLAMPYFPAQFPELLLKHIVALFWSRKGTELLLYLGLDVQRYQSS